MATDSTRIAELEKQIDSLRERVSDLEQTAPVTVPIETLAPEPYEVLKPFHAVIHAQDDEYLASFFDANVNASGATHEEALFNLKDTIVAVFKLLSEHDPSRLGRGPARQLQVLKEFLRKKP